MSIERYKKYVPSEGEWCNELPSDWGEERVKDIFRLVTDAAPDNNDFELLSLYASIGVRPRKDLEARGNKASSTDGYWLVEKGDIVVNKLLAWMGGVGLSEYSGVTSPAYDVLRKIYSIEERYFGYLFRTEVAKQIFKKKSRGIMDMRLRLYFDKLGAVTVPVPPLSVQREIVTFIDKKTKHIDQQINLLTKKAEHYNELKQSLINQCVTKGLNKTAPMKNSGIEWIGEIPEHWEVKRLKELAVIQNSNVDKKSRDDEESVILCNYVDVYKNDFIDRELSKDFMRATASDSEIRKFKLERGDVLITKDSEAADDIAVPALAVESLKGVLCGYHLAQIRADRQVFLGAYLLRIFQSSGYGFRFTIMAKGITRVGLGQSAIADALTPVPPLSEQRDIVDFIDVRSQKVGKIIESISIKVRQLKELRKSLINDVVTGRIKVIES